MEKLKTYNFVHNVAYLVLLLLAYWLGLHSYSFSNKDACTKEVFEPVNSSVWKSTLENLTFPEVHSPVYLITLAKYEQLVYYALADLARTHSNLFDPKLLSDIEAYLYIYIEDMEFSLDHANITSYEDQARLVGQNPILALNMIWRFANELTQLCERIKAQPYNSRVADGPGKDFLTKDIQTIAKWPNKWTVEEAFAGFLRLQMVYDLDVTELSTGRIFGVDTGPHMRIPLMNALGNFARAEKMYTLAIPWLELTWDKLYMLSTKPTHVAPDISIYSVENVLMATMMEHDNELADRSPDDNYFYMNKLLHKNQTLVKERHPIRKQDWALVQRSNMAYKEDYYWDLCSGGNHQTEKEKAKLTCWYDQNSDPALSIFPIKKELLSQTPYIVQMYDVIGESVIKKIIEPNTNKLTRSRTVETVSLAENAPPYYPVSKIRTSVDSSVQNPLLKLTKLVELVTGLNVEASSEKYVVTSYAFGGHYDCHLDAFEDEELSASDKLGNRIATMMFYLDDTQIGGRTAFPVAGTAAKPVKGSALFWYNLKRNGNIDLDTYHCACPLVLGQKTEVTFEIDNSFVAKVEHIICPVPSIYDPMVEIHGVFYYIDKVLMDELITYYRCIHFGNRFPARAIVSTKWIRARNQFRKRSCGLREED